MMIQTGYSAVAFYNFTAELVNRGLNFCKMRWMDQGWKARMGWCRWRWWRGWQV